MKTLWLASAVLLITAPTHATFPESANYRSAPDGVFNGGGASVSSSYIATQQVLGEISGRTTSPSYQNQVGFIHVIEDYAAVLTGWELY